MAERDLPTPVGMEDYIRAQILRILEGMYHDEDVDFRPDEVNPEDVEGDYYREYISKYGTIYVKYPVDEDE